MQRNLPTVGMLAMLLVSSGCGSAPIHVSEPFSLDVPWDDYQRIVVRTTNGRVELTAAEGDRLLVAGVKQARGITLVEAQRNLDELRIVAEPDKSDPATLVCAVDYPPYLRHKGLGVSFDIRVPQPCATNITTANGRIQVRGTKDAAKLHTSNGRIIVEDLAGRLEATTSNGRIIATAVNGDCELRTSNGRIELRDAVGNVRATTSNGSISVRATPPPEGQVILRTSNGAIHVVLPKELPADLHLSSSNGRVRAHVEAGLLSPFSHCRSTSWGVRFEELEAAINGGGCRVEATTSNGSVTLDTR